MKKLIFMFAAIILPLLVFGQAETVIVDFEDGVTPEELETLQTILLGALMSAIGFLSPSLPWLKNFTDKRVMMIAVGITVGAVFLFVGKFYSFGDVWQPIMAFVGNSLVYILALKPLGIKTPDLPGEKMKAAVVRG